MLRPARAAPILGEQLGGAAEGPDIDPVVPGTRAPGRGTTREGPTSRRSPRMGDSAHIVVYPSEGGRPPGQAQITVAPLITIPPWSTTRAPGAS